MNKQWLKNKDNSYTFFVDNTETGLITFTSNSNIKTGSFAIGQNHFAINKKGFWSSTLLITGNSGEEVAKMYAEKWYANNWVLEYAGKKYKISVRNNPLAEYVIVDTGKEILAYGLDADKGKVQVKITGIADQTDFLFDFLLWYLFAPVAAENMGDNLDFILLTA